MKDGTSVRSIPTLVEEILERRGLSRHEMADFIYPDYDQQLHDPFLLTGMEAAVERIEKAADLHEDVVIYGDYDIDGITASAIMIEGLAALGLSARSYIPDRFEEGYGINQKALEELHKQGVDLIISVDCGITSVSEAAWALKHGLDLIITDHHMPPQVLPIAIAVVNPKQTDDQYPFKDLCGAGVAFKLIQGLQARTGKPKRGQEKWLLDLVALGTVCDIVDLIGENRVLVSFGLKVLHRTRRPGIASLSAVAGTQVSALTTYHLGFALGPRMNAAGRLEHAGLALELLQTYDPARALLIAEQLDTLNQQRRALQDEAFQAAQKEATRYEDDPVLVLAHADWSHGIVGIVASKLVDSCRKPVLVAQILGEATKGSARSVGSFNMVEALRSQAELLTKFGGHYYAAGYTLPTSQIDKLRLGLNEFYRTSGASVTGPAQIESELDLNGLSQLNWETHEALALLEPHGAANPAPVLRLSDMRIVIVRPVGKGGKHARVELADSRGDKIIGIAFGLADRLAQFKPGNLVTALGRLDVNEYQGRRSLQLLVSDIQSV
jgi:single-stranded-DNA-specific exonuclease